MDSHPAATHRALSASEIGVVKRDVVFFGSMQLGKITAHSICTRETCWIASSDGSLRREGSKFESQHTCPAGGIERRSPDWSGVRRTRASGSIEESMLVGPSFHFTYESSTLNVPLATCILNCCLMNLQVLRSSADCCVTT